MSSQLSGFTGSAPDLSRSSATLYRIIGAIAQGPDPGHVLPAVAELLVEATAADRCLIYLREGRALRLRAAAPSDEPATDRMTIALDEGLCGWVVRHRRPATVAAPSRADGRGALDSGTDRSRSTAAAPLVARGDEVVGVVVLHTDASLELGGDVLELLTHVSSLVAGAIDTDRVHDRARRQLGALATVAGLGRRISSAGTRADLYRVACDGVGELLGGAAVALYRSDSANGALEPVASSPASGDDPAAGVPALRGGAGDRTMFAALASADRELGALVAQRERPFDADERRLLDLVANQLAVALEKAELVERLTEEDAIAQLFAALAEGRAGAAELHARAAGHDVTRPHVIGVLEPLPGGRDGWRAASRSAEAELRRMAPGALCEHQEERLRAFLPLRAGDFRDQLRRLDEQLDRLGREHRLVAGRGAPRRGLGDDLRSLGEATTAARVARSLLPAGGARSYADLGVYRYLAHLPPGQPPDERHTSAVHDLLDYDRRRQAQLAETLERYLGERGGIAAAARALFVHTNTLRQRLERIEQITGLTLADEDLLSLELAVKLARLRPVP